MTIMILDGQGGGLGQCLIEAVTKEFPNIQAVAVGTNSAATAAMVRGTRVPGATGENAVVFNASRADVIIAPLGAFFANGLLGEISAPMANALSSSPAYKIGVCGANCPVNIAGRRPLSTSEEIKQAVALLKQHYLE